MSSNPVDRNLRKWELILDIVRNELERPEEERHIDPSKRLTADEIVAMVDELDGE